MVDQRAQRTPRGRSSLRGRLLAAQVSIVLPLVVVAGVGAIMMNNDNARYERSRHAVAASAQIAALQAALNSVQADLTSPAMMTGDPTAAVRLFTDMNRVDAGIDKLRALLPEQGPQIELIGRGWDQLLQTLRTYDPGTLLSRTAATDVRAFATAMSVVNARITAVLRALADTAAANAAALRHELAVAHNLQRSLEITLMVLAVAGLVMAVITARRLHRTISKPLHALREGARRIGNDEPGAPVPAGEIPEFAEVATAFNMMVDRLTHSRGMLADRERWFRSLVKASSDVVAVTDLHGMVRFVTPSVRRILGYPTKAIDGKEIIELLHPDDADHARIRLAAAAGRDGLADPFECRMIHLDQNWRYVEITINNQLADRAIDGLVLTIRDVTEARRLQEQLGHQAFHDDLTGLANRALFADRLTHTLSRRSSTDEVAVIFLDLDDFKGVNDSLGHSAGDLLLTEITARINGLLRESTTAARLGGDEFAVLLDSVTDPGQAEAVAERLLVAIRRPIRLGETEIFPRASVGVAIGRPGDCTAEEMLRRADTAMYQAKGQGKDGVVTYTEDLANLALRRLELSADLRHAIDRGELQVHYQPTVRLKTGTVSGVEALARWNHPRYGAVSPVEFIPLAEETGVIIDIGRWVLNEACRQTARWQDELDGTPTVSVNVSGRQLQHPGLLEDVTAALANSGLAAEHLVLEITESVVLHETTELMDRLHALKALGIRLAIDDFGTGYNSLSYLQRLPIDILKVDRSFITGIGDADGLALVTTILRLARDLRLETVAEGVEKPDQIHLLRELDCTLVQGFHYARPIAATDLPTTVARIEQTSTQANGPARSENYAAQRD
jgi:diguanylate cyclase (GGDEF)-like protein/PAS domain S-box-containing protein